MCGRYTLEARQGETLCGVPLREDFTSFNIAPTQRVPILLDRYIDAHSGTAPAPPRQTGVQRLGAAPLVDALPGTGWVRAQATGQELYREIYLARWGLIPPWYCWDENPKPPALTFNARCESLFEKATYASAAVSGHCAIPTSGYYEWRTVTSARTARGALKERKVPQHIGPPGGHLYLAGIYTWHRVNELSAPALSGPGYTLASGQWLLTFSILTMDSPRAYTGADGNERLRELGQIHERMPVPLSRRGTGGEPSTLKVWLASGKTAGQQAAPEEPAVIESAREGLATVRGRAYEQATMWQVADVSERIGNIRNNDRHLLERDEDLLTLLEKRQ